MMKMIFPVGLVAVFSLVSAGQVAVPIEKEPMHRLKLENEFVRVFDVLVTGGTSSLFHTHVFDGVGVRVSNADMMEEFTDGRKSSFVAKWGNASFGSGPEFSHRVINVGKNDFRNIYVELLRPKGPATTGDVPPLSSGHAIVIDNARVRVNRLALNPGESSQMHTHSLNGLAVIVYDARIEITVPGSPARVMEVRSGDFVWQTRGTRHVIKNVGKTNFEAMDIELK